MTPQRVVDRLLSKYTVDENGCWISLYSTGSHGYSQIGWVENGKTTMALGHRISYEQHVGPIPKGLTIDHVCRVRRCINPDHLRLMDNVENASNHGTYGKPVGTGRTCGKGLHELLLYPSGAINCRECALERTMRKRSNRN